MSDRDRPNLLDYLARPIEERAYLRDDAQETSHTRQDQETYDDDPGVVGLGLLYPNLDDTDRTAAAGDTYDDMEPWDPTLSSTLETETYFIKVAGETYDNDASSDGLSFPP